MGILFGALGVYMALSGTVYTDTIKICAHISDRGSMTVIDTNQNVYYVNDQLTQFKVKDNTTIKVKIKEEFGSKTIYSIDAPITCGGSSCGVTS